MATIKRPVAQLSVSQQNVSQFFHQMAFKGIVQNNNPYDVDQLSLRHAKNVYIDENGTLVSRPPIAVDVLPPIYTVTNDITTPVRILQQNQVLVDFYDTGKIALYVGMNAGIYEITAVNKEGSEFRRLSGLSKYHVSVIENYIIVFNNLDAKVLDINDFNLGWRSLSEFCEIPVTKRVVGQETFDYPGNQFTDDYKEEYVFSEQILMALPEGQAKVEVSQSPENLEWTLDNAGLNTEFRILRGINVPIFAGDIITTALNVNTGTNVLAIARPNNVLLSADFGQSFERILYPVHPGFSYVASISKDGLYFFFVARDGVYRYSIANREWVVVRFDDGTLDGVGINNACCFLNADVFTFTLHYVENNISKTRIYWKGPNLWNASYAENTIGQTEFTNAVAPEHKISNAAKDCVAMTMFVRTEGTDLISTIVAWLPGLHSNESTVVVLAGVLGGHTIMFNTVLAQEYGSLLKIGEDSDSDVVYIECNSSYDGNWYTTRITVNNLTLVPIVAVEHLDLIANNVTDDGAPVFLLNGYMIDKAAHSVDGIGSLPLELVDASRMCTVAYDRFFYTVIGDKMYTNKLPVTNSAKLVYTRSSLAPYTKIPTVSYMRNELFLAFDNVLMITENIRVGGKLWLNLPAINNHSFPSNVNTMVNVSTVEVAIFFINKVYIVSKVEDSTFGYRYDYLPTRLTAGTRAGEHAINTANGASTLYPTAQGLAVLNYQKDVSNTDQVSEYLSNNITALWTSFYKAGSIKMVQMRDYIYLYNGTNDYLMLDTRGLTWWTFTSPYVVRKIVTDNFDFKIVSNGLYRYDHDITEYKDAGDRDIEWLVESQPNHFNAPVYYKNLKQLIFQLEESSTLDQTMAVQIKLYRKSMTIREPEIIGFSIDSYKTCVKRFNYWKINEMQWSLGSDPNSANSVRLQLNGISIKYEISEEVRS